MALSGKRPGPVGPAFTSLIVAPILREGDGTVMGISFLFVDTERVWRGGQDQLFTLLQGLSERNHGIHLVCHPNTLLAERAREIGLEVHPISIRGELSPFSFTRLLWIMLRIRPSIVAFNTPRPILVGKLASWLAGVRVRIIFRRVNFPLRRTPFTRLKYLWGTALIIAISESISHQLQEGGIPASKIRLVYDGIDAARHKSLERPPYDSARQPVVVGSVSHLSKEKGHYHLVEAAHTIPEVASRFRFVVVGDGVCKESLEAQVRERGLEDCFQFAGFQSRTTQYLQSFDIFVLPSLSEGLSSAILSAMASSLPVIATSVGGIPELIQPGVNGLLVPPADPVALAQAIVHLHDHPEIAIQMGREGRRRFEKHFTLDRKIAETELLCESILKRKELSSHEAHA